MPESSGETILIIDDESGVREITRMLLQSRGYRVLVADSGPVGLSLYRGHPRIDAVVTDMMMPGMQGGEVIAQLRSINPDARIVAMSGVIGEQTAVAEEPGRLVFLPKPMPAAALFRAVRHVLD
jgi:CheY-like chemotaxis protein